MSPATLKRLKWTVPATLCAESFSNSRPMAKFPPINRGCETPMTQGTIALPLLCAEARGKPSLLFDTHCDYEPVGRGGARHTVRAVVCRAGDRRCSRRRAEDCSPYLSVHGELQPPTSDAHRGHEPERGARLCAEHQPQHVRISKGFEIFRHTMGLRERCG